MSDIFITGVQIDEVRHLHGLHIELPKNERKHLVLTGKNGSGKTSVLEAMKCYLSMFAEKNAETNVSLKNSAEKYKKDEKIVIATTEQEKFNQLETTRIKNQVNDIYSNYYKGLTLEFTSEVDLITAFKSGNFIVAYYDADRLYKAETAQHIEKIKLQDTYTIVEKPGNKLVKYLLDLKTTQALAGNAGKKERAEEINEWFRNFEGLLQEIFDDNNLKLDFNIDTFAFSIDQTDRQPFDFNTMSSGYSAIIDIIVDLMMRMENKKSKFYNLQGIVLIDEIETHLHIELQKKILPFLIKTFPNVQFVVSTHSPFILNSVSNAVVYDLEKKTEVTDLSAYSYEGIVEHYFGSDVYSDEAKQKLEQYKVISAKKLRSNEETQKLFDLITYFSLAPSDAAPELVLEFIKLEEKRKSESHGEN